VLPATYPLPPPFPPSPLRNPPPAPSAQDVAGSPYYMAPEVLLLNHDIGLQVLSGPALMSMPSWAWLSGPTRPLCLMSMPVWAGAFPVIYGAAQEWEGRGGEGRGGEGWGRGVEGEGRGGK
jgi:hypothetical protein